VAKLPEESRRGRLTQQRWEARPGALGGRQARQSFVYSAYVPEPISNEEFTLNSTIAAAVANADAAVRDLNQQSSETPNLEVLARQLLRAESVASSRIEGLILGHRRLAQAAFHPDGRDITATGVLANIDALEEAVRIAEQVDAITPSHLVEIHEILFRGTSDEGLGGVIREEQNWIGGAATSPRNAEFVPPPPEYLDALLADLCVFLNRNDLPTLIQAAIAHAQFETIHPFHDGNGRVGRALISCVLRRRGLAPRTLPPVSLALAGNARGYVTGLTSFRNADEEDWYTIFVDAVHAAATRATAFAHEVTALQRRWSERAGNPRSDSGAARLIALLPSAPIIDIATATTLLGGSDEQARLAIIRLEKADILRPLGVGKRNRAWETVGLFDLLDRLERDLGSPQRTPRPTREPTTPASRRPR
jgi:Fic family protein